MYAMPIVVAVAIVSGFCFGWRQYNILITILMMAVFVAIGFAGYALGTWSIGYGLKMIFFSCLLCQVAYVLGITFSKND